MDHSHFKANQTAAVYVADGLDPDTLEAFEIHMMECPACVEDVETWRAVKSNIPARTRSLTAARGAHSVANWRMAASLLLGGMVGASGGWFGRALQGPNLTTNATVFFAMPALERGADECTRLRLAAQSTLAVLRLPGIPTERRLLALDSEKQELTADNYSVRVQPDGSRLLSVQAHALLGRAVHLETRDGGSDGQPLGCITATTED